LDDTGTSQAFLGRVSFTAAATDSLAALNNAASTVAVNVRADVRVDSVTRTTSAYTPDHTFSGTTDALYFPSANWDTSASAQHKSGCLKHSFVSATVGSLFDSAATADARFADDS